MQSDETSSPQRFSRSKQATPGTSPLKRDAGDSSEASDSQPDVVRALNRNTVAVEMLAQAIQKMSERLGHAPRTGISLDKSRTSRGRNDDELLSMNEVRTMVGGAEKPISKTLVRQLIRERKLPDPVRIGPKTFRWRKKAVEAAIQEASESDI